MSLHKSCSFKEYAIIGAVLITIRFGIFNVAYAVENASESKGGADAFENAYCEKLLDKIRNFREELKQRIETDERYEPGDEFHIRVHASNILEESLKAITEAKYSQLMAKDLRIFFKFEDALGYEASRKEWFTRLSTKIFDPKSKYFRYTRGNSGSFEIRPMENVKEKDEKFFKFVGRVVGMAMYNGNLLKGPLSRLLYTKILGKSINLTDIEEIDPRLYKDLSWIRENDPSCLQETFRIEEEDELGEKFSHNLIWFGDRKKLDQSNKTQYIDLLIQWKFSPEKQTNAFLKGFHELIPLDLLQKYFDETELQLLLHGIREFNIDDWKKNTKVIHMDNESSPNETIVKWFWEIVEEFDNEKRAQVFEFATGLPSPPIGGFGKVYDGFLIYIRNPRQGDDLPVRNWKKNAIVIPIYDSRKTMKEKLEAALKKRFEMLLFI